MAPVLTAVLAVDEYASLDHAVDCPVCGTDSALTPERMVLHEQLGLTRAVDTAAGLQPSTRYEFGRQVYVTDAEGLPGFAAGELVLQKAERHREATDIGHLGEDTDHGGHLIAARFGGFGSGPNVIPQNMVLNRSGANGYGDMENTWAQLLKDGYRVFVDIRLEQSGAIAARPEGILVQWRVERVPSLAPPHEDMVELMGDGSGTCEKFFPNEAP